MSIEKTKYIPGYSLTIVFSVVFLSACLTQGSLTSESNLETDKPETTDKQEHGEAEETEQPDSDKDFSKIPLESIDNLPSTNEESEKQVETPSPSPNSRVNQEPLRSPTPIEDQRSKPAKRNQSSNRRSQRARAWLERLKAREAQKGWVYLSRHWRPDGFVTFYKPKSLRANRTKIWANLKDIPINRRKWVRRLSADSAASYRIYRMEMSCTRRPFWRRIGGVFKDRFGKTVDRQRPMQKRLPVRRRDPIRIRHQKKLCFIKRSLSRRR